MYVCVGYCDSVNIRTYDFWTVVKQSGAVTQQLCRFVFCICLKKDRYWLLNYYILGTELSISFYLASSLFLNANEARLKIWFR